MKYRCLIRNTEVAATPEERVRQALLNLMIHELGYPKSNFVVEKCLTAFGGPERRLDILFFRGSEPYLLIECKKEKIDEKAKLQVLGYNHYIKSKEVALASWGQIARFDGTSWIPFLEPYTSIK